MIFAKPTKYGAGLTIYGDYFDLTNLHGTIHDLSNKYPLEGAVGDFVLGLAYDIRHAYEGSREKLNMRSSDEDVLPYFGVRVLWPIFLAQVGLLRWAAGFQCINRGHQADLFRLEECAERALSEYDPFVGKRCFDWLSLFPGLPVNYLTEFIFDCTLGYVAGKGAGKSRFKRLPDILFMIQSFSEEYRLFRNRLDLIAKEKGCSPHDLVSASPWPRFKW